MLLKVTVHFAQEGRVATAVRIEADDDAVGANIRKFEAADGLVHPDLAGQADARLLSGLIQGFNEVESKGGVFLGVFPLSCFRKRFNVPFADVFSGVFGIIDDDEALHIAARGLTCLQGIEASDQIGLVMTGDDDNKRQGG